MRDVKKGNVVLAERQRRNDQFEKTQELIGRKVAYRTPHGEGVGTVLNVLTREQAENEVDWGVRPGPKQAGLIRSLNRRRLRSGNYLVIEGADIPIRRSRCRVLPQGQVR